MIRLATIGKWWIVKSHDPLFNLPYALSDDGGQTSRFGRETLIEAWRLAILGRQVWLEKGFPNKEAYREDRKEFERKLLEIDE